MTLAKAFRVRRRILGALGALCVPPRVLAQAAGDGSRLAPFPRVVRGYPLRFPRDHGAHPEFRTEWWYLTGWLNERAANPHGFEITFFRTRPRLEHDNPSAFTPQQLLIAHAALTDPGHARLQHDQRTARAGFALAGAESGKARVWIDDWSLAQEGTGFQARITARGFAFEFSFAPVQSPLLNGEAGFSRKGAERDAASYYYSMPQLAVSGTLTRNARTEAVAGTAWLDHEWSSSYLERGAVGWDWIGINTGDGGALMAFRMRDRDGNTRWAGATYRGSDGKTRTYDPHEVGFVPRRTWRSPRSGTVYPVAMDVTVGAIEIVLEPLIDDQEFDARLSTGAIYWEGAVHARRGGEPFGKGYLELTGYWRALRV